MIELRISIISHKQLINLHDSKINRTENFVLPQLLNKYILKYEIMDINSFSKLQYMY